MLLYFIYALAAASGDDDCDDFPTLKYQPCSIPGRRGVTYSGFSCPTTDNGTCLRNNEWCKSLEGFEEGSHCNDYSNLKFDSCFKITSRIDSIDYMLVSVGADWDIAEQYCQSQGYNLVSFEMQSEFDAVLELFAKLTQDEVRHGLLHDKSLEVEDPTGQRCDNPHFMSWIGLYWTGLFYDKSVGRWRYSDGVEVNEGIKSKGSMHLGQVMMKRKDGYMAIDRDGYRFKVVLDHDGGTRATDMVMRPRILCKKSDRATPEQWSGKPASQGAGCITGFQCPDGTCLAGTTLRNSQVCDGVSDCSDDSDESDVSGQPCSTFTTSFPDGVRAVHFFPLERPVRAVRSICKRRGWFLPSLHSKDDVSFLLSLPAKYSAKSNRNDFRVIKRNWTSLEWNVLLGIDNNGSHMWDDGSRVDFLGPSLSALPNGADIYLSSSTKELVAAYDSRNKAFKYIFVVCQERSYTDERQVAQQQRPGGSTRSQPFIEHLLAGLLTVLYTFP